MQAFNDVSGGQGIVQDIDFLANSDPTTYLIADKVRNCNNWIDTCVEVIMSADGRWQWDDPNQTDLPRATTTLYSGQTQYNFDASWLDVQRVEVKDTNGNWMVLTPIDQSDIKGQGIGSYDTTAGVPSKFDVDGENIFLYPAANYTLVAGMKIFFQRKPVYLTVSSTTTIPAFVSTYNRIISMGAASDWALTKDQNRYDKLINRVGVKNPVTGKWSGMLGDLQGHYASRNKFEKTRIIPTRRGGNWGNGWDGGFGT
jgi:hypothetical protein